MSWPQDKEYHKPVVRPLSAQDKAWYAAQAMAGYPLDKNGRAPWTYR